MQLLPAMSAHDLRPRDRGKGSEQTECVSPGPPALEAFAAPAPCPRKPLSMLPALMENHSTALPRRPAKVSRRAGPAPQKSASDWLPKAPAWRAARRCTEELIQQLEVSCRVSLQRPVSPSGWALEARTDSVQHRPGAASREGGTKGGQAAFAPRESLIPPRWRLSPKQSSMLCSHFCSWAFFIGVFAPFSSWFYLPKKMGSGEGGRSGRQGKELIF